jgi:hypothetical protein
MQVRVEKRAVAVRTRRGHDWTGKFPALSRVVAKTGDCILDGGLCALDKDGNPDFTALISTLTATCDIASQSVSVGNVTFPLGGRASPGPGTACCSTTAADGVLSKPTRSSAVSFGQNIATKTAVASAMPAIQ